MPTCTFCKKPYKNPRGLTVYTFDGRSIFYCSSKCRRNAGLGRDPKKTNWVKKEIKEKNLEKPIQEKKGKTKNDLIKDDSLIK